MRNITCILIFVFIASLFLAQEASAQEQQIPLSAEKAVVLFTHGNVMVQSERDGKWIDATAGMTIQKGESLKTGPKSWAEIGIISERENVFRVQERTLVSLIDLTPVRVSLLKGEVRSLVQGLSAGSSFQVETPTAICGARGTGWDTKTNGKKVVADALENSIFVQPITETGGKGQQWTLDEGKRGTLRDPAKELKISDVPLDKMRDWNRWKEDFTERRSGAQEKKEMETRTQAATGGAQQNLEEKVEQIEKTQEISEGPAEVKESRENKKDQESVNDRSTPPPDIDYHKQP